MQPALVIVSVLPAGGLGKMTFKGPSQARAICVLLRRSKKAVPISDGFHFYSSGVIREHLTKPYFSKAKSISVELQLILQRLSLLRTKRGC